MSEWLEPRQLLSVSGSFTPISLPYGYSLTQQGTADWAHWTGINQNGTGAVEVHKATGGSQISNLSRYPDTGNQGNYGTYDDPVLLTWNDGNVNPNPDPQHLKVWQNANFNTAGATGFFFTVPADTAARTLYVVAGGHSAATSITAQLLDGSGTMYTRSEPAVSGDYRVLYAIDYAAGTNGQTLKVTLAKTGNMGATTDGSVDLVAAWLVTDIPAAPSGLHAMTVSPTQVDLTWDDNSNNEDGFKIDYSTNNFSSFQTVVAGADTGSKWITGLQSNTPYEFRVRAVNAQGESVNATFVTAQTAIDVNQGDSKWITVNTNAYGFTDTAIRNAITDSHDEDTIYIPPGTYTISSSIALLGGGRVYKGATALTTGTDGATTTNDDPQNQQGTVIQSPAGQAAFTFDGTTDAASGMYNVRVTGLTFTGWGLDLQKDGASPPTAVSSIAVDNCHFNATHDYGISGSTGIRNTIIANNLFDVPSGVGIYFYGASSDTGIAWDHLTVANNQIQAGHSTGFHIDSTYGPNSTHLLVEQNYATQVGGLAFEIQGTGTYTNIQDNYYYYDDPWDSASTIAFSIPVQDVIHPITRRNYAWAKLSHSGEYNGVRSMYELGGYNVGAHDNYSRGGYFSIQVTGSNSSGVVHDNQISNYIYAPYNDNGGHDLLINNGSNVPLTWDLNRPKPGPGRRAFGLGYDSGTKTLTVGGTKLADTAAISTTSINGDNFLVFTLNGEPFTYPVGSISKIVFAAEAMPNSPSGTTIMNSLQIPAGLTLDLTNNSMIIDYTGPVGSLVTDTRTYLHDGALISSSSDSTHKISYGDNAVLNKTTFAGVGVDSSSLLIKFTYGGDANLDGKVDVTDLGLLATNWQSDPGNNVWTKGDFNYDGNVDVTDLGTLATNWQAGADPVSEQSFNDAWNEVRGNGRGEGGVRDDGLTDEDWDWLLSLIGTNVGGPTL